MKKKNHFDEQCKRVRKKIMDNRDTFRRQQNEFSFIFNEEPVEQQIALIEDRVVE